MRVDHSVEDTAGFKALVTRQWTGPPHRGCPHPSAREQRWSLPGSGFSTATHAHAGLLASRSGTQTRGPRCLVGLGRVSGDRAFRARRQGGGQACVAVGRGREGVFASWNSGHDAGCSAVVAGGVCEGWGAGEERVCVRACVQRGRGCLCVRASPFHNGNVIIRLKPSRTAKSCKIDRPPRDEKEPVAEPCNRRAFFFSTS